MINAATAAVCLERGLFADDPVDERLFRRAMAARIQEKSPIFPNRSLGFEFAAINDAVPRGYPVAAVALANLRPGERFVLHRREYSVESTGKSLRFTVRDASGGVSRLRLSPAVAKWESFCRDVDGLLLAAAHGCDAGDLLRAWHRDPVAQTAS